jgi:hypothetical protein
MGTRYPKYNLLARSSNAQCRFTDVKERIMWFMKKKKIIKPKKEPIDPIRPSDRQEIYIDEKIIRNLELDYLITKYKMDFKDRLNLHEIIKNIWK